jgi:uncharacterized protein YbjT (DUF2867 family)
MVRAMRILVTGASGFAGAMLIPRLMAGGHEVRAMAREPERVHAALASQLLRERASAQSPATLQVEVVRGDVLSGEGLEQALEGAEVAYYLIHSMERLRRGENVADADPSLQSFPVRERYAAERFARAAARAGTRRIVYLGGLLPREWEPSRHLASRYDVERILLAATPDSVALRASIVIGARSRSFRLLVRLVERLPLLALPPWARYRTQPIDGRDLTAMLGNAADVVLHDERTFDVAGPDLLSYQDMLERVAQAMLVSRPPIRLRASVTPLSARVAAAIAGEDPDFTLSLMEALKGDLLPATPAEYAAHFFGVDLHSFAAALEHALREWEITEPLAAR